MKSILKKGNMNIKGKDNLNIRPILSLDSILADILKNKLTPKENNVYLLDEDETFDSITFIENYKYILNHLNKLNIYVVYILREKTIGFVPIQEDYMYSLDKTNNSIVQVSTLLKQNTSPTI